MLMKTSNILSLLSAALLTGALLLFAGCEKEKNKTDLFRGIIIEKEYSICLK